MARIGVLGGVAAFALLFGLLFRLHPYAMGTERIIQFFITEDGYLMLTVARNLAIGLGMSVSEGTIASNGVQPLATLIYAIGFWLVDGDKVGGVAIVLGMMVLFWTLAALAVRRFAEAVLGPDLAAARGLRLGLVAWAVAALWSVGPLSVRHSMNALETGLYVLCVVLFALVFGRIAGQARRLQTGEMLALGAMAGLAFWARNDAVFLIASLFFVRFVYGWSLAVVGFARAFWEGLVAGVVSLLIGLPWLLHNKIYFGSFVPISGTSQSHAAEIGGNLGILPAKLFETMFPMLPLPAFAETSLPVQIVLSVIVLGVWGSFLWRIWRVGHPLRLALLGYSMFGVLQCFYYGTFFGAPHFLSRYLFPLSPLLVTAAVAQLIWLAGWVRLPRLAEGGLVGAILLGMALTFYLALPGRSDQGHFQVVTWVQENVPEEDWVAAVQTGTLGFWHDRTINLDGKVNPDALAALLTEGHFFSYIVANDKIRWMADWYGMAAFGAEERAGFRDVFEVVVADEARNLAVLRRVNPQ
jgi:hypothetical protein